MGVRAATLKPTGPQAPPVHVASEHDPNRSLSDSPAGSVASSNLSRATAAGGGRGGNSVERQLYKALKALAEQASNTFVQ